MRGMCCFISFVPSNHLVCQTTKAYLNVSPSKRNLSISTSQLIKGKFSMEAWPQTLWNNWTENLMQVCLVLCPFKFLYFWQHISSHKWFLIWRYMLWHWTHITIGRDTKRRTRLCFVECLERCKIRTERTVRSVLISCENWGKRRADRPQIDKSVRGIMWLMFLSCVPT